MTQLETRKVQGDIAVDATAQEGTASGIVAGLFVRKKNGRDLAVPAVEEDTSGILKVIVKIYFQYRIDQARSLLRRTVGVFRVAPNHKLRMRKSQQHTVTPKHPPLCARGLTCLRIFAWHESKAGKIKTGRPSPACLALQREENWRATWQVDTSQTAMLCVDLARV